VFYIEKQKPTGKTEREDHAIQSNFDFSKLHCREELIPLGDGGETMKRYVNKYRKIPKFNRLPANLRKSLNFLHPTCYARFYGNFETITGRIRRFSFQLDLGPYWNGAEMYQAVRRVCSSILQNRIPIHEQGQIFRLDELFDSTPWIQVRRVLDYKVGMTYG
jgi:hypothetical protein